MIGTARLASRSIRGRALVVFALAALLVANIFPSPALATVYMLEDENSTAQFDDASQAGAFDWEVDGVGQLNQQWFWYRVGNNPEASIDTLTLTPPVGVTDTNFDGDDDTLFLRYDDPGGAFKIEVRYTLDGGLAGSGASDMGELIAITNLSEDTPLDFHFFQYTDFDLQATASDDSAVFTNVNAVRQYEASLRLTETVVTPPPNHREASLVPTILNKLNDGVATNLSDTPFNTVVGPGDLSWAFQWDFLIPPETTFQISKDKNLQAVPEPSSWALLGISAALLAAAGWRRRRR